MISFWAFSLSPGIFYATRRQDRVVHTRNPRKAAPQHNFVASVDMRGPIWDWGAVTSHPQLLWNKQECPEHFSICALQSTAVTSDVLLNTFQKQVKTQMVKKHGPIVSYQDFTSCFHDQEEDIRVFDSNENDSNRHLGSSLHINHLTCSSWTNHSFKYCHIRK